MMGIELAKMPEIMGKYAHEKDGLNGVIPYRKGIKMYRSAADLNALVAKMSGSNCIGGKYVINQNSGISLGVVNLGSADGGEPQFPEDIEAACVPIIEITEDGVPVFDLPKERTYYGLVLSAPPNLLHKEPMSIKITDGVNPSSPEKALAQACVDAYKEAKGVRSVFNTYTVNMILNDGLHFCGYHTGGIPFSTSVGPFISSELYTSFPDANPGENSILGIYQTTLKEGRNVVIQEPDLIGNLVSNPVEPAIATEVFCGEPFHGLCEAHVLKGSSVKDAEVIPKKAYQLHETTRQTKSFGGFRGSDNLTMGFELTHSMPTMTTIENLTPAKVDVGTVYFKEYVPLFCSRLWTTAK